MTKLQEGIESLFAVIDYLSGTVFESASCCTENENGWTQELTMEIRLITYCICQAFH